MSPRKVREVANEIQGRSVPEALDLLALIPRKSARLLAKTLKSAVANSENDSKIGIPANQLRVHRALVGPGPVLKRFKAGAKGSAKPRVKRMSHLRIVLTDGKSN
jgi:large subunit ribosomal protein L22